MRMQSMAVVVPGMCNDLIEQMVIFDIDIPGNHYVKLHFAIHEGFLWKIYNLPVY